jgi:hypothetical protein
LSVFSARSASRWLVAPHGRAFPLPCAARNRITVAGAELSPGKSGTALRTVEPDRGGRILVDPSRFPCAYRCSSRDPPLHIRSRHHCRPQSPLRHPLKTARARSQTTVQEGSLVGEDRVRAGFEARKDSVAWRFLTGGTLHRGFAPLSRSVLVGALSPVSLLPPLSL